MLHPPNLNHMEVQLAPDLQAKLTRMSAQQGRSSAALITEAVERLVNHDTWFTSEVEKGVAAADRGELTDHQAVRAMIESRTFPVADQDFATDLADIRRELNANYRPAAWD